MNCFVGLRNVIYFWCVVALVVLALRASAETRSIYQHLNSLGHGDTTRVFNDQHGTPLLEVGESFVGIEVRAHIGLASPPAGCTEVPCPEFDAVGAGPFPQGFAGCDNSLPVETCPWVHRHGPAVDAVRPLQIRQDDPFETSFPALSRPWVYVQPTQCCGNIRDLTPTGWNYWWGINHVWNAPTALLFYDAPTSVSIDLRRVRSQAQNVGPLRLTVWPVGGDPWQVTYDDFSTVDDSQWLFTFDLPTEPAGIEGIQVDSAPGVIHYGVHDVRINKTIDCHAYDFDATGDGLISGGDVGPAVDALYCCLGQSSTVECTQ